MKLQPRTGPHLNERLLCLQFLAGLLALQQVLSMLPLLPLFICRHLGPQLLLVVLPQLHCCHLLRPHHDQSMKRTDVLLLISMQQVKQQHHQAYLWLYYCGKQMVCLHVSRQM